MSQRLLGYLVFLLCFILFRARKVTCWLNLDKMISTELSFGFNQSVSDKLQPKEYSRLNIEQLSNMSILLFITIYIPAVLNTSLKYRHYQLYIGDDVFKSFSKGNLDPQLLFLREFTRIPVQECWTFPSSLGKYLNQSETTGKEDCMNFEWGRYETFKDFPMDSPARPLRLASNGFFYTGSKDIVRCFSCHLEYSGWQEDDDPNSLHKFLSPNCVFMNGTRHSNVPINPIPEAVTVSHGYQIEGATGGVSFEESANVYTQHSFQVVGSTTSRSTTHKYPNYKTPQSRLDSFDGWTSAEIIEPIILANAGFFFVGINDFVRCFSCGGGLRNWEYGVSPWEEHARWFPWCRYLIEEKGLEFVRQYQELQTKSNDELPKEKILSGEEMLKKIEEDESFTNHQTGQNGDKNGFERRITRNITEQLNEMGVSFSSERIRQEINRLKDIDHQILTAEIVITNLIDNAENLENHEPLDVNKTEERRLINQSFSVDNTQTNKETDTGLIPNDIEKLQEENTKLKNQLQCKICMDSNSNVVFIPCGHMVSCEKCALHIRKCTVCKWPIKGRVKALEF